VNSTLEKEVKTMYSKRRIILALAFLLVLTIPFAADGLPRTIMGEIQGLNCAMKGLRCPEDKMDVHVATEPDFVLVPNVEGSSTYYLLPNLPRDVKVRHVGGSVIVTGDLHPKDNSIVVDRFEIQRGMFHGIVWTKELQQRACR
jgi:hypothetical protein